MKKCKICNKTPMTPHLHHKDGNKKNNSKDNLIVLCSSCHAYIHSGICKSKRQRLRTYNEKSRININNHKYDGFSNLLIKKRLDELREVWIKNKYHLKIITKNI